MKKRILVLFVMLAGLFTLSAETGYDCYVTGAYNFNVFTERADKATTTMLTNAIDVSLCDYFGKSSWGLYFNIDLCFPFRLEMVYGGISYVTTNSDYTWTSIMSAIIGPTYKYNFNDNFQVFGAIGPHLAETSLVSDYSGLLNFSFGLGGDVGIKYLFNDKFYMTAGALFSHDFYCAGELSTSEGDSKTNDFYNFGRVGGYIGVGVRIQDNLVYNF